VRDLLSIADLGAEGIAEVMKLADAFVEVAHRDIARVPALRGKTVVSLFYEDSTRTRLSFETAAKRLSADTMTFSVGSSSVTRATAGTSIRPRRCSTATRSASGWAAWRASMWPSSAT